MRWRKERRKRRRKGGEGKRRGERKKKEEETSPGVSELKFLLIVRFYVNSIYDSLFLNVTPLVERYSLLQRWIWLVRLISHGSRFVGPLTRSQLPIHRTTLGLDGCIFTWCLVPFATDDTFGFPFTTTTTTHVWFFTFTDLRVYLLFTRLRLKPITGYWFAASLIPFSTLYTGSFTLHTVLRTTPHLLEFYSVDVWTVAVGRSWTLLVPTVATLPRLPRSRWIPLTFPVWICVAHRWLDYGRTIVTRRRLLRSRRYTLAFWKLPHIPTHCRYYRAALVDLRLRTPDVTLLVGQLPDRCCLLSGTLRCYVAVCPSFPLPSLFFPRHVAVVGVEFPFPTLPVTLRLRVIARLHTLFTLCWWTLTFWYVERSPRYGDWLALQLVEPVDSLRIYVRYVRLRLILDLTLRFYVRSVALLRTIYVAICYHPVLILHTFCPRYVLPFFPLLLLRIPLLLRYYLHIHVSTCSRSVVNLFVWCAFTLLCVLRYAFYTLLPLRRYRFWTLRLLFLPRWVTLRWLRLPHAFGCDFAFVFWTVPVYRYYVTDCYVGTLLFRVQPIIIQYICCWWWWHGQVGILLYFCYC